MDQLHVWVASIERAAADLYHSAAYYFSDDPVLSAFLQRLAGEEEWHCRLLQVIPEEITYAILPDPETRQHVEDHFRRASERLQAGALTRDEMHELVATVEFSEWNDFFLYCLANLRGDGDEYRRAVSEIGRHKEEIVAYFARLPGGERFLTVVRDLPEVQNQRILVVEAHPGMALLLRGALSPLGEVEVAASGQEGLSLVANRHFDVVLSNIDLGPMASVDFFQRAVGLNPALAGRFLFFSGSSAAINEDDEHVSLPAVIAAPARLGQIRQAVEQLTRGGRLLH